MLDEKRIEDLHTLEKNLSYTFKDVTLFDIALTHRSYVNENKEIPCKDNEIFEFLGDAVLQLCISDILIRKFPEYTEGQLSKLRASMVNEQPLAIIAQEFRIGEFILLGKGEEASGGRTKNSILANTVEAVIGAIYLDRGYIGALAFIKTTFHPFIGKWIEDPLYKDHKSLLQEISQSKFKTIPKYTLIEEDGPDHDKTFTIQVSIGDIILETGKGKNKKEAEQEAAKKALEKFEL